MATKNKVSENSPVEENAITESIVSEETTQVVNEAIQEEVLPKKNIKKTKAKIEIKETMTVDHFFNDQIAYAKKNNGQMIAIIRKPDMHIGDKIEVK
jgi:hypothetical protein